MNCKSLAIIDIIAIFSFTDISSKHKALYDLEIIPIFVSVIWTTLTLSSFEYILILGVPVNITSLLYGIVSSTWHFIWVSPDVNKISSLQKRRCPST